MINKNKKKKFVSMKIRRSQVASIYGVGSIYQFKDTKNRNSEYESLMLASIDEWFPNLDDVHPVWTINEPRLQSYLNKDFFVIPPDYRSNSENQKIRNQKLPYIRFPRWHRCPSCGLMQKVGRLVDSESLVCNAKEELKNESDNIKKLFSTCLNSKKNTERKLIPVRFLVACEHGHIDDFPFEEWVHLGSKVKANSGKHIIKSFGGRGGNSSLLGLKFKCVKCNSKEVDISRFFEKNLDTNIKNEDLGPGFRDINHSCTGNRPWIGDYESNCKARQKVLLRGASNVYYPTTKSSIYIPIITNEAFSIEILELINNEDFWNLVKDEGDENLDTILKARTVGTNLKVEILKKAILKKREGLFNKTQKELEDENFLIKDEEYKFQEYDFIINKKTTDEDELVKHKFDIKEYKELGKYFSSIILVDKLKETRVHTGFSRLNPYEGGSSSFKQTLGEKTRKWLPAIQVHGEGIFFEFNKEEIEKWTQNFDINKLEALNKNYNKFRIKRKLHERVIDYKFLLIHTFSHLLMNRLCFNCGYSSASLKERIYCNLFDKKNEMQGVLIYTSAGDSEGTLGGLVREGEPKNLNKIVYEAVSKAVNCSYDPVCIQTKSQGLGGSNSSSCHACTFVSETSCEENNQLLNRTLIIGDKRNNSKGFFEDLINS